MDQNIPSLSNEKVLLEVKNENMDSVGFTALSTLVEIVFLNDEG